MYEKNLEKIKKEQAKQGFKDKEKLTEKTLGSINLWNRSRKFICDNRIELLMQTEGFAVKQMPKFNIDLNFLSVIREAMTTNKKITAEIRLTGLCGEFFYVMISC